jgi:quinoprotein glucose dehydrogenase
MSALFILLISAFALQGAPKTIWDGVYTDAQAKRGEAAYTEACSRCHRDDLSGYNGVLVGGKFMDRWREDSLNSFFRNVQKTMPRDAPASLSDSTYLDIVAYVLRRNQFPAGTSELTVNALPDIRVQTKEGPEPVPDFALVEVKGCMTQNGGAWEVVGGTEPVRTRNPGTSAGNELAAINDKAPGTHTFLMMDLDSVDTKPDQNQTALVKGFLMRDPKGDRINLTSLQLIGTPCAPAQH